MLNHLPRWLIVITAQLAIAGAFFVAFWWALKLQFVGIAPYVAMTILFVLAACAAVMSLRDEADGGQSVRRIAVFDLVSLAACVGPVVVYRLGSQTLGYIYADGVAAGFLVVGFLAQMAWLAIVRRQGRRHAATSNGGRTRPDIHP